MIAKLKTFVAFFILLPFLLSACSKKQTPGQEPISEAIEVKEKVEAKIKVGAERTEAYLPILNGKNIVLTVNQTSIIGETHLVDSLLSLGVSIEKIFAPEHGFRGHADAGEQVKDGIDQATGVSVVSLYGKKKKPSSEDLKDIDMVVFDIQDVGARFYTYISSMTYLMEACAENDIPMLILDRPNPNGHYVDGPVMEKGFESFVGMHVGVPVVHGMTVGEYAQMANGEGWLVGNAKCELKVITCENYDHFKFYELPIKPSPNLPNMRSIYLYPSLCFFEGTNVSVGRGTDKQFQIAGMPDFPKGDFTFTPESKPGAKYPKHEGKLCRGYDLTQMDLRGMRAAQPFRLDWLIDFYENCPDKKDFFLKNNFIDKLAGGETLRKQIIAGESEEDIRASWQEGLYAFKLIRQKYLLYN